MKTKLIAAATIIGATALIVASLVGADTTPLSVSCSGSVSNNVITWNANATGGVSPYSYLWSGDSKVAGSTSTSITATYTANGTYTANVAATDATSSVATSTCSAVISYFTTPTTTPHKLPWFNEPTLSIGPKGAFLSRGMTITSVGTNSFQAQVWGITYTVNWVGYLYPKFYFRLGNPATSTFNPVEQLDVGDEVGVSGKVSTSSPFVVNATIVRNYSSGSARPIWNIPHKGESDENKGKSNENKSNASSAQEMNQKLNSLLEQLKNLQEIFKNTFGKK